VGSQIFVPQTWNLGLEYGRFAKDQVSLEEPGTREEEVEGRVALLASRTLGSRLTLVGQLSFADRTITAGRERSSLSGISDPELIAHYRVLDSGPGSWLSISLGLRPGWGQNDRQLDGERAEEHLQPGTGAWSVEPGAAYSRVLGADRGGALFGSVMGRLNGRSAVGYHYGNVVLANLGYERKLAGRLNGVLEANFRRAGKDEPVVGEQDPNTGGSVLYLSPRVLVKLDRTLFLRLGVQVPVIKDLYGDQDEKVNVFTGLTLRF
jgi:hypothetical protein